MQSPRNFREWQQAVERQLKTGKNGIRMAVSHANDAAAVVDGHLNDFKGLTPTAPITVTYSTSTYIDQNRKRRGKVIADFPDVVLSTNAKPIVVENYEIAGQDQSLLPLEPFQSMGTSDVSSIVTGNLLPGSTWKFKVRALGGSTVKPGVWSSEQTVVIVNDTTPPPVPSAPVVTAVSGAIKVVWDGLAAGGGTMPGDFDRVEVAFGLASSPTAVVDTFYAGSLTIIPKVNYNVPHYVRLRAFDTTGNVSAWSVQGVGIPVPLVDADIIIAHLDGAVTEITNIGQSAIQSGAVTAIKLANGAVDATKLADAVNAAIANGSSAYSSLPALTASVNGKNTITNATTDANAVTIPGKVSGDIWQKWTTLAAGGKLLKSWRWDGAVWVAELMDATYLPLVDIGAGTFNDLNGDRLVANSVAARAILVGDFQNFAIGSDFEDPDALPWTLPAEHTISTVQKKFGTSSLRMAPGAAGVEQSVFNGDLRVKEGEVYYFKFHAYADATFNGTASGSKLRIGDQANTYITALPYNAITKSVWTTAPLELTVTVPAGVTALTVTLQSDHTAGLAYIDDIQIRRVAEASLIQNLGVEKLTASVASMAQATIDKLWSDVVRSRRMTTDMMVVGRGVNGIVDEFFVQEDAKTYRNTLAGGWGAWAYSGTTQLNMYTQGALTPGTARSFYFDIMAPTYSPDHYIPVEGGQVWLLKMQYTSATSGPRATVRYLKRDGTVAYQSAGWTKRDLTANVFDPPGTVRTLERIFTVPADVTHIMPAVQFESTCTSATVYGGATFTNMATSSLIVDGAISARNLTVTEEMWTNILHFKQLTGLEIDVNALGADTGWIGALRGYTLINDSVTTTVLKADAITSKHTLTGATIQTLATASRGIKLSGGNFTVWNSTGSVKTLEILGATGAVNGTGVWKTGSSGNYIEMTADAGGGLLRFWTGSGTGRGNIYARDDAGGKRMTITYSDLDAPAYTVPLIAVWDTKVNLSYGSMVMQVGKNAVSGVEEMLLNADGSRVTVKGNMALESGRLITYYNWASGTPVIGGYVGQRPETAVSTNDFELRAATGTIRLSGTDLYAMPIWNNTTASAANVFIGSDGLVKRVSSASRYKADQQVMDLPDSLLDIPVKDWTDVAAHAQKKALENLGRPMDDLERSRYNALLLHRFPGVIAEDVEASDPRFVVYGPDGRTESVMYERLAVAQVAVLKRQLDKAMLIIEELQQHVYNA